MGRLTLDEVRAAGWARGLALGPLTQAQADEVAAILAPYQRPAREPQAA
jgi:hypothetical protein